MQIFYLPKGIMIISYFVVWGILQVAAGLIGDRIPREKLDPDSAFYRTHKWEKDGKIYKTIFKVDKWKHLLPDGAVVKKGGFAKKNLRNGDPVYLENFIKETVRAELVHWLQLPLFWVFGLWSPWYIVPIMFVYAVAVNAPCIIAQRYNRPRLKNMLKRMEQKNNT